MHENQVAEMNSVPAQYRGQVLTSTNALIENVIYLGQFILFIALGLAPAIAGGLLATGQIRVPNVEKSFIPVLVGLAASALLMWFLMGWILKNPWSADFMFGRMKSAIVNRPDALVDANSADAVYVEVIPRRNWNAVSLQNADDVGLLLIDQEGRLLLFEGDNKRGKIPAASIVSCNVELMNPSAANADNHTPIGLAVLTCRDSMGEREIPLRPVRTVGGESIGGNHVARAEELQRRITSLMVG